MIAPLYSRVFTCGLHPRYVSQYFVVFYDRDISYIPNDDSKVGLKTGQFLGILK